MATDELFAVELEKDNRLKFNSFDEIERWIGEQRTGWEWFISRQFEELGGSIEQSRHEYAKAFQRQSDFLQAWKTKPEDQERANNLQNAFSPFKGETPTLLLANDPTAVIAREIAKSSGSVAGAAALGWLLNVPVQVNRSAAVEGVIRAILVRDGIDKEAPSAVADVIQSLNDAQKVQLSRQESEWAARVKTADEFLQQSKAQLEKQIADHSTTWEGGNQRFNEEAGAAIQSIKATEAAYTTQMQLQASVNYWNERATGQHKSTRNYLIALGVFIVAIVVVVSLLAVKYLPTLIAFDIGKKPEAYAVAIAITGLFSTVIFWIARVLVRLYLSAHHLALDATERVVMIQTYLALLKEGKLVPEERSFVLTPLFRSSADGIIKDEGAPDMSLAALLSRLLDRRGSAG